MKMEHYHKAEKLVREMNSLVEMRKEITDAYDVAISITTKNESGCYNRSLTLPESANSLLRDDIILRIDDKLANLKEELESL